MSYIVNVPGKTPDSFTTNFTIVGNSDPVTLTPSGVTDQVQCSTFVVSPNRQTTESHFVRCDKLSEESIKC